MCEQEGKKRRAGREAPDLDRLIPGARREADAVGRPRDGGDSIRVPQERFLDTACHAGENAVLDSRTRITQKMI